jgi:hypothetical protein
MAEKDERYATKRAFAGRPEIKHTFEDAIKDGSAGFEIQGSSKAALLL